MSKTNKGSNLATKTQYKVPALDKGLDILELLASSRSGMTQKEIADALSRTLNEIFRMLVCLDERGYIAVKEGTDRYQLTLKIFELSHRYPPIKRMVEVATPVMHALAHKVEQSCHLVVFNNGQLLVVAQVDSPGRLGFSVRLGTDLKSLSKTASGQIFMAHRSIEERGQLLLSAGEPYPVDFDDELAAIKRRGFVESPSLQIRGIYNQSFPIYDYTGELAAVLTVPFVKKLEGEKLSRLAVREVLNKSSDQISSLLGANVGV
ncbi:MAG: IclR family transcriptional regulator [Oceanospirillaceae bacterium]|nr:IclR family transcriptional regulator [Oceanospirillaceae bacterium]